MQRSLLFPPQSRRRFLAGMSGLGFTGLMGTSAWSGTDESIEFPFVNGHRNLVKNFPQKGAMVLQRARPPLLETPFEVFDQGVFTPNDRFYVRWHLANIPTVVDPGTFRLNVRGHVNKSISFTLDDLVRKFKPVEIAAVNQCSGNSRGFFAPRVAGGEWANGAMGNALWRGVTLKALLDRAGVKVGALQVRFNGLDTAILPQTPDFMKSLHVDHAIDGEVMIAYAMNGKPLPLLNGYPLRLVVPGWYAIPINRMVPRSFFTNVRNETKFKVGETTTVRGIAFGGDTGLAKVLFSADAGGHWQDARLGPDHGKYSFRQWSVTLRPASMGSQTLMVKAFNMAGASQPDRKNWNGSGFMRNVIESVAVQTV